MIIWTITGLRSRFPPFLTEAAPSSVRPPKKQKAGASAPTGASAPASTQLLAHLFEAVLPLRPASVVETLAKELYPNQTRFATTGLTSYIPLIQSHETRI